MGLAVVKKDIDYIRATLDPEAVHTLLQKCDEEFVPSLSQTMNLKQYAQKLSDFAQFVIALDNGSAAGFVAYYLNDEGHFIYVPLIWVSSEVQRNGIGQQLIAQLSELSIMGYSSIRLEVLKSNTGACHFYLKEDFKMAEDRNSKWLMSKDISK